MIALEIRDLSVSYRLGKRMVPAVSGIDLTILRGTTLGLVGESGSGKSTVAKAVVQLVRPASGEILVEGKSIDRTRERQLLLRRRVQMVFQDPNSSLNPRSTVRATLLEAAGLLPNGQRMSIDELVDLVSLPSHLIDRFPHELSGGQKQRVAIARALAVRPSVLIADEITASLDVSVQASVLSLLADLQERLNLSCLFISHNLAVVRHVASDVAVMNRGEIVERGASEHILISPSHGYTRSLLAAIPRPFRNVARPAQDSGGAGAADRSTAEHDEPSLDDPILETRTLLGTYMPDHIDTSERA